jgi:hypothetical protein
MTSIPYAGAERLTPLARRSRLVRALLAAVLVALVAAAAASVLNPRSSRPPLLPPSAGGIVVLDLSASITEDTYSRIHETLQELVSRGGRYGLVVFSNVAYEALPPGTPASALAPIARYFAAPAKVAPGEQPRFPANPWSATFTSGTEISQGLDLARRIEVRSGTRKRAVVLISDLADDANDLQRLNTVLAEYELDHVDLRVLALAAQPNDVRRFADLVGNASGIVAAPLSPANRQTASAPAHTAFPTLLVVLAAAVAAGLAANELYTARLTWAPA